MTTATAELARIEARRMMRHPAPWVGMVLMVLFAWSTWDEAWSGQRYTSLVVSTTPLLLGISIASITAFGRELVPVADDAPLDHERRSLARLTGGLTLLGPVVLVIAAGAAWLWSIGGVPLGDEPGRTLHAHHTLPELLQPLLLAGVAVAAGAATVHVLRRRLAAAITLTVGWFLVGATYWLFEGALLRLVAPVQVQPSYVDVGPADADPGTFPASWLLSAPGQYQDHWARVVVSPALGWAHDLYLLGLVALLAAVAVPGATRRLLLVVGAALAVAGVLLQWQVAP